MGNLKEENFIKIERIRYKSSTRLVYYYKCNNCFNMIKPERKYLNKHSGLCRFCVHKGTPYLSSYNHLKEGISRTNKKRKKQKSFELTFKEFLEFVEIKNCHYCNRSIDWIKHSGNGSFKYNLDRKDSNLGYSLNNCVVCCKVCNYMKGSEFSYEEFIETIKLLNKMRNNENKC